MVSKLPCFANELLIRSCFYFPVIASSSRVLVIIPVTSLEVSQHSEPRWSWM